MSQDSHRVFLDYGMLSFESVHLKLYLYNMFLEVYFQERIFSKFIFVEKFISSLYFFGHFYILKVHFWIISDQALQMRRS